MTRLPSAKHIATWAGANPAHHSPAAHAIATRLKTAGANAGVPKRWCALSIPMATAANDTRGRNGSMTRVSRTVASCLPGTLSNPGASTRTSGSASTKPSTTSAPSSAASTVMSRLAIANARSRPPWASARA